ncbi:MAG: DUF4238 domain-containing protein [Candidatus Omnitrophota bacterium]
MAEYKKQHYVPRCYLRFFSNDQTNKLINLYNIKNNRCINNAPLNDQCYEKYYYGKNPEQEKRLSKIESAATSAIENILKNGRLPKVNSEQHLALILFILLQTARTPSAESDSICSFTSLIKELLIYGNPQHKKAIKEATIRMSNMPSINVASAIRSMFLLFDLKYKLFRNRSHEGFITSDHPAVKYNFLYEKRKNHLTKTGFATRGLQIFIPISSRYCLMFYDGTSYKFGFLRQDTIDVTKPETVDSINCLQLINRPKNIYFDNMVSSSYVQNIVSSNQGLLADSKFTLKKHPQGFYLHEQTKDFNLKIPTIRIIPNARKAIKTSDIRNPELLRLNNMLFDNVDKQNKK